MSQQASQGQHSIQSLREVTNLLYQSAGLGILLSFIAITTLTFFISSDTDYTLKYHLWAILMVILALRTLDLLYWFVSLRGRQYPPQKAHFRVCFGLITTALIWSAFFIFMFQWFNTLSLSTAMIIGYGIVASATSSISPNRYLCLSYITIIAVPLSLLALFHDSAQFSILGALGLAYWLAMLSVCMKSHEFVKRTITLKYSNLALLNQVQGERDEVERINHKLQRSNEALDHANASLEVEVSKRTEDIYRLLNRDPLTGLMNRSGFMHRLNRHISNAEVSRSQFALLFIDLDGFKQVNDSLGHQIGDNVLQIVAERLSRYSEADNLGRWGGDEFVMYVPYANADTATAVASATRNSLARPVEVDSYSLPIDATIGIALYPEHATDAQNIVQLADLSMYRQKKLKPGSYCMFEQSYYDAVQVELNMRDGLRRAIEQNEFSLAYQPIVKAEDYKVRSVEALLRWQFAGENVSPAVFIPLAEKSRLIIDIGNWVLHRACIDAAQWQDSALSVSVNVSVIQLMDDKFISTLDRVLTSSGLAPNRLHIEITESVFVEDTQKVSAQVNAIKQRNVVISIDDFGTGFSSLSQLQSLEFDQIKIDRAFVQKLEEGSDTIVRATLLIAKEFGSTTIAEGIETEEDAIRLYNMGVDCLQGYYFARPMPNSDLQKWLKQYKQ